jgi:hypothetical protein
MFTNGGKQRFEALVALLLRDLDQFGSINAYAASSKLANQFRRSGYSEHETALAVCIVQATSLFKSGQKIQAISLLGRAKDMSELWIEARSIRPDISAEFFRQFTLQTGWS